MDYIVNPSLLDLCARSYVDLLLLSQAIEQGQDVNMLNHRGESSVLLVCRHVTENPLQAIERLVAAGACLHQRDLDGNSALHVAISASSPIVPFLLVDPNLARSLNYLRQSPLHVAARSANEFAVTRLTRQLDIDQVDLNGYSPLMHSIQSTVVSIPIVQHLLDHRADPNLVALDGTTPLVLAALENKRDLVSILSYRGAHLRHVDNRAICHAITRLDETLLKLLLQSGADPNAILPNNAPILFYLIGSMIQHQAWAERNPIIANETLSEIKAMIQLLLDYGAHSINALYHACCNNLVDVAAFLLESKLHAIDLNQLLLGKTLLSIAIAQNNRYLVHLLLDHGADINYQDDRGKTCLFECMSNRNMDLFNLCLERGANPFILDDSSTSVLHLAARFGMIDVIQTISAPALLNIINQFGMTPLLEAIENGQFDATRALLDSGASVHQADRDNYCPLQYACKTGNLHICQLLYERGADINARGIDESTPLFAAIQFNHNHIVEWLLDHGASPFKPSRHFLRDTMIDASPMDLTIDWQDEIVAPLLAKQGACDKRLCSVDFLWRRESLLIHVQE